MRLALLAFAVLAFAAGCGGGDGESAGTTTATTTTSATNGECATVEAPEPRDPGSNDAPTAPLEDGKTYALTFDTSCGSWPPSQPVVISSVTVTES